MSEKHAIVKKLPSVESLGSVDVICVDKTGTLTLNQMIVTHLSCVDAPTIVLPPDSPVQQFPAFVKQQCSLINFSHLLQIGNLCNNARFTNTNDSAGSPTEIALLRLFVNLERADDRTVLFSNFFNHQLYHRSHEFPFNSEKKWMAVQCHLKGSASTIAMPPSLQPTTSKDDVERASGCYYVKGAPEMLLVKCKFYLDSSGEHQVMSKERSELILKEVDVVANKGHRIIAMAFGPQLEELVYVGFVAMIDPPRPGVSDAIQTLQNGGVRVVMITGDAQGTAISIAKEVGILPALPPPNHSLSGSELDNLSERELLESIRTIFVYYRAAPRHKMMLVKAFQSQRHIVAMTGVLRSSHFLSSSYNLTLSFHLCFD